MGPCLPGRWISTTCTISEVRNDRKCNYISMFSKLNSAWGFNTLRQRWNRCHFADNIFKCIYFNEDVWISIKMSWKFIPKGPINNIPALVQIMAWWPGDKPLSEPMMIILPIHICVTQPQWINTRGLKLHSLNKHSHWTRGKQQS